MDESRVPAGEHVELREYQLRRFAAETLAADPWQVTWQVTSGELVGWIAAHDWSPESRRSYRSALRSFGEARDGLPRYLV